MARNKQKHEDTSVSLWPLTFEESIAMLAQAPKQTDSPAEESDKTTEHAPESAPSKQRTVQGPKPSES